MFLEKRNSLYLCYFSVSSALKITQGDTTVDCPVENVCHAIINSRTVSRNSIALHKKTKKHGTCSTVPSWSLLMRAGVSRPMHQAMESLIKSHSRTWCCTCVARAWNPSQASPACHTFLSYTQAGTFIYGSLYPHGNILILFYSHIYIRRESDMSH